MFIMSIAEKFLLSLFLVNFAEGLSYKLTGSNRIRTTFNINYGNDSCVFQKEIKINTETIVNCEEDRLPFYYLKKGDTYDLNKVLYLDEFQVVYDKQSYGDYCRNIRRLVVRLLALNNIY